MQITQLSTVNFRRLKPQRWGGFSGCNLITGDNAQGKTSFIEAIYYACTLRSFRTNQLKEIITTNQKRASIDMEFIANQVSHQIKVELDYNGRRIMVDGKQLMLASSLVKRILPVLMSSEAIFFLDIFQNSKGVFLIVTLVTVMMTTW